MKNIFTRKFLLRIFIIISALTGLTLQVISVTHPITLLYFYTILTNILCLIITIVLMVFTNQNQLKENSSVKLIAMIRFSLCVSILIVMLVYHFILRPSSELYQHQQNQIQMIYNLCLHYIVPILFITDWVVYNDCKESLSWKTQFFTLVWPIIYCLFVYIRAFFGKEFVTAYGMSKYPYFFLDIDKLGLIKVGLWIAVILLFHLAIGYGLAGIKKFS